MGANSAPQLSNLPLSAVVLRLVSVDGVSFRSSRVTGRSIRHAFLKYYCTTTVLNTRLTDEIDDRHDSTTGLVSCRLTDLLGCVSGVCALPSW